MNPSPNSSLFSPCGIRRLVTCNSLRQPSPLQPPLQTRAWFTHPAFFKKENLAISVSLQPSYCMGLLCTWGREQKTSVPSEKTCTEATVEDCAREMLQAIHLSTHGFKLKAILFRKAFTISGTQHVLYLLDYTVNWFQMAILVLRN